MAALIVVVISFVGRVLKSFQELRTRNGERAARRPEFSRVQQSSLLNSAEFCDSICLVSGLMLSLWFDLFKSKELVRLFLAFRCVPGPDFPLCPHWNTAFLKERLYYFSKQESRKFSSSSHFGGQG